MRCCGRRIRGPQMSDDESRDELDEALQSLVDHGAATALESLNRLIDRAGVSDESRSGALGLRADLRFDAGDLSRARSDLLLAHGLVPPGYLRYVHELSLGSIWRAEGNPSEALKWYRSALQTCLDASGVSGGTALKNLLALVGDEIGSEDMALCRAAIARSWAILGLSGEAAKYDLTSAIAKIKEGEARLRS
jgi:tetratricopeptide (TPR) repeat protein